MTPAGEPAAGSCGGEAAGPSARWRWLLGAAALFVVGMALAPTARDALRQLPWALERLQWGWAAAAVAAQALMYVCLAGILAVALGALGYRHIPFRTLVPTAIVFLLTNRAVPGPAVVGMAVLADRLRRRGVPPEAGHSVASTFFGADYAGFLAIGVFALPILGAEGRLGPLRPPVMAAAAGLIVLGGAAAWAAYRAPGLLERLAERAGRLLARIPHFRREGDPECWARRGREAVAAYREHVSELRRQPAALFRACLWGAALHAVDAATLVLTARAFGWPVSYPVAAAGYLAGNLGAIVSFLPGGVGLYDAGMIAALHAVGGVPTPEAGAATLLYRLVNLWLPLPLAAGALRRRLRA